MLVMLVVRLITLDHIYQYGIWAGSRNNLLDKFDQGRYYVKIYDVPIREE